jgi:hypothetical protein
MKNSSLSRRNVLKTVALAPFMGSFLLSSCKSDPVDSETVPGLAGIDLNLDPPDNWFKYCRPILEWINPHPDLNGPAYVEQLIDIAKKANANTVYHLIDFGGSPLFNGSIEPKYTLLGDFDLLGQLEKRLHEEGMYFVAAQFGAHTQSSIIERHPDWAMRDINNNYAYGPGAIPLVCFNSPYKEYTGDELARVVKNYKTDGVYVEGLYYSPLNCYCKWCKEKYLKLYGKPIPANVLKSDLHMSRFQTDSIVEYMDSVTQKIKKESPSTVVMACPPNNNSPYHRVDWHGLGKVCDIVTLERMWGYGFTFPFWNQGMNIAVMEAESKKTAFTTAWYAHHVDREYTPRTKETMMLNYYGSIIHGGTAQFHTQNALEEAPDSIPVLNEIFSYTEKIRPWLFHTRRLNYVSLLYERDQMYPAEHFSGYYKALIYNHIPFKVISREDLNTEAMKESRVLILPNVVRLSDEEINFIQNFTDGGGTLISSFKTGFGDTASKSSSIAQLLGVKEYLRETKSGKNPPQGVYTATNPQNYRIDWNFYFRCEKDSFADKAAGLSLLSYTGALLEIEPAADAKVSAFTLNVDPARQSLQHPVYGFYPGETNTPLILERTQVKGKVVYFAGELDKAFGLQGYKFLGDILTAAVNPAELPVVADAPDTVEITWFANDAKNYLLVNLLNATTNQRDTPDPVTNIFPVMNLSIKAEGYQKAFSLNGTELKTKVKNGSLIIDIPVLNVVETLILV